MADDTDKSQKTEEPTPKKLQDARDKGQVASSREINHWFMLLAASIIFMVLADSMAGDIARTLVKFIERPDTLPTDADGLNAIFKSTIADIGMALVQAADKGSPGRRADRRRAVVPVENGPFRRHLIQLRRAYPAADPAVLK